MADLMKPITSLRVKPTGGHAEVTVFVNHACCGALLMRVEEAEEFKAALERAERVEAAATQLLDEADDATDDCLLVRRSDVRRLRAALTARPGEGDKPASEGLPPYVPPQAPHDGRGWTRLGNGDLLYGYWRITGSPTAWTLLQERGSAGAPTSSNNFGRFATIRDAKLRAAEIDRETSTRRVQDGVVHEMADLGVKTQCGLDLQEPWTWTDDPVTCESCQAVKAAAELAEERVQVKEA